jgi:hypothetical protein
MANKTGKFGLRPLRHLNGAPWNGATVKCYIGATYDRALFIGDPVLLSDITTEKDPTGRYPTINASDCVDADMVRGVIDSFEPLPGDLSKNYNPTLTARIANVVMDGDVLFAIRGDGGGTVTALFPGQNAVGITTVALGSTVSGLSEFMLDEGTTSAPAANQSYPLLIHGILEREDNELGDNVIYEVLLNTNENIVGRVLGVQAS